MQPLVISTSFSSADAVRRPRADQVGVDVHLGHVVDDHRHPRPSRLFSTWFSSVVFPAPRKPDRTVTGRRVSATRAWDSLFYALSWAEGDEVIIHASDYGSNTLSLLQMAARRGIVIRECPSDPDGQIDVQALETTIGPRTRLISLSHIPTQGGLVNPAAEVGRVARANGVLFLLDACQSLGQVAVNVPEIGCDMLSGTGRKFLRGPRGTGVLYVGAHVLDRLDPPFIDGHSARVVPGGFEWEPGARRFEAFEQNFAGKAALARAVDYALDIGLPVIETRIAELAEDLRDALASIPGVTVRDLGRRKGGIVTFTLSGVKSREVVTRLAAQRINVSLSYARWAPIDFAARGLPDMVRASVHAYNSGAEVDRFAAAVAAIQAAAGTLG
jgi:cysteine desulfurase / selenocysteine lyase